MKEYLPAKVPPELPPEPAYEEYGPGDVSQAAGPQFPFRKLLGFLLRYWWIPILTLIVSGGAAAWYVSSQPPTFVSKARMWETVKLRLPEGALFAEDVQNFLGTQTELLQSSTIRKLVIERLKNSGAAKAVAVGKDGSPLSVAIRVTPAAKSSIFVIEATSSDPNYTRAYLDALMSVFLDYKKNIRQIVSGDTLASISEQVQRWERDLKDAQDLLTAFQQTNNMAILQEEGTVAGGYLTRLKTQLSDLELEQRILDALEAKHMSADSAPINAPLVPPGALGSSATTVSSGAAVERQTDLELLKAQREKLIKFLRPKHPKIVKLDGEIERGERQIEIYQRQTQEQLAASRQAAQMKIDNIKASIKEWEGKVVIANNRIAEAERLKLNVQRIQSVYDRLVTLVQNVGISRNLDQETLAVLEPAGSAKRSYSQETMVLAMAIAGGLALGVGFVFLLAVLDDRFASLVEVNEKFAGAVVGQVPQVTNPGRNKLIPLIALEDDRHVYAESYRNLRSALYLLRTAGERPRVVLVTSAVPNEGKSTIAANLAKTLALGGSSVVLVDADLRRGRLHELLGMQRQPGLAEILRHQIDFQMAVQRNSLPNLAFISRGGDLGNPGDLFMGGAFNELLAQLRNEFDYVLIDSTPVFVADDATTLAPKMDGTLFVVRRRFSRNRMVREALELLHLRQATVLGLVFNGADASANSYYYYRHADYYGSAKQTRIAS